MLSRIEILKGVISRLILITSYIILTYLISIIIISYRNGWWVRDSTQCVKSASGSFY